LAADGIRWEREDTVTLIKAFIEKPAWAGIAGFAFLTLFTFVATFVQAWYVVNS
jgi:hypothetical protein